jgi:hypothetical protein
LRFRGYRGREHQLRLALAEVVLAIESPALRIEDVRAIVGGGTFGAETGKRQGQSGRTGQNHPVGRKLGMKIVGQRLDHDALS